MTMIHSVMLASPLVLVSCTTVDREGASSPDPGAVRIHVNQVALERVGPKHAIVAVESGKKLERVTVIAADGSSAVSAEIVATAAFTEWGQGLDYYRADFSALQRNGAFRLEAATDAGDMAQSAEFRLADNALFDATMADVYRYFRANRNTSERDRAIPVIDTGEKVDVYGGWNDAGGETGKYLSHLSYSNFFTPQQASFVAWSMLASYGNAHERLERLGLREQALDEAFWGADYLHRVLSDKGYFYATVFDRWGSDEDRWITGYKGLDGVYTPNYQAAFREGAGLAIAALARAARLSEQTGRSGEFAGAQYLADARRAFAHLLEYNADYCDDGRENIIDDYTALLAAVELFRSTADEAYLAHARQRAGALVERLSPAGYFIADDGQRPFFHAVEAGLPAIALLHYVDVETDAEATPPALAAVRASLEHQLRLDAEVPNPFAYPRQNFQTFGFESQVYTSGVLSGFFIPHANETGYWWQGENARLASLAAAAALAQRALRNSADPADAALAGQLDVFIQNQFDWLLGRNPYDLCMLYGFGQKNPEFQVSGGAMVKGGISNGITGKMESDEGRGIDWMADTEHGNWRWVEQWTPHGAWYLYAVSLRLNP